MDYGSVCSGVEAATLAWQPLGWNAKFFAEVEPFPSAVLQHRFGATKPLRPLDPAEATDGKDREMRESWKRQIDEMPFGGTLPNLGDFTKIKEEDYEGRIDLLAGGTPCFPAGNLVLTERGYVPIEDVTPGTLVMTHMGRLRRVLRVGSKTAGDIGVCRVVGRPAFRVTGNHPFLTGCESRNYSRKADDYLKLKVKDIGFRPIGESGGKFAAYLNVRGGHCEVAMPELPEAYDADEARILELCGWYLGDGYIRSFAETNKKSVVLCLSKAKLEKFAKRFEGFVHYCTTFEGENACKVTVYCTALAGFLEEWFGCLAPNKRIPAWVYGLREDLRNAFLDGYRSTDGCTYKNATGYSTVSKALAYGVADICSHSSVTEVSVAETAVICGRTVRQRPWFRTTEYPPEASRKFHAAERWVFGRVRSFEPAGQPETVYNMEVEDDNSYVCNGLCVHNCQSYSLAGLRRGLADPRGNLALEFVRLAYRTDARWTVWENVPGVLSSGGGNDFASFLSLLCGWEVPVPAKGWGKCGIVTNAPGCFGLAWRILDAQYTRVAAFPRAIPQRRRRLFVIGYRGGAVGDTLDWQHPAKVLFDGEMREGDTPPSREARKGASAAAEGRPGAPAAGKVISLASAQCGELGSVTEDCLQTYTLHNAGHSYIADATTLRMREGCPGGGKGPLVSEGKSLTLGTSNDQALFVTGCATWWDGTEKAGTLTCTGDNQRMPDRGRFQCVIDMRELAPAEREIAPTLVATDYKGGKAVLESACPTIDAHYPGKMNGQDLGKLVISGPYGLGRDALSMGPNAQFCMSISEGVQPTLTANGPGAVCYENHGNDSRITESGETCPTITSRAGTGGNNLPFVLAFVKNDAGGIAQGYWYDVFPTLRSQITPAVCFNVTLCDSRGKRPDRRNGGMYVTETDAVNTILSAKPGVSPLIVDGVVALDGDKIKPKERSGGSGLGVSCDGVMYTQTAGDVHAVAYATESSGCDIYNGTITGDFAVTVTAAVGESGGSGPKVIGTDALCGLGDGGVSVSTVRRLLPVECERLMGFPDNHTRIPWKGKREEECPDAPRYKACGNSMCVNVMSWLGERIQAVEDGIAGGAAGE